MNSLKSYIQVYGTLKNVTRTGNDKYTTKISCQKKKKRFLFECSYTNGNSTSSVKMYMPISKKKASYTIYFNQTIRAGKKVAKMSGKTTLKRKTYNDNATYLKITRKNKTSISKKITNRAYQNAGNTMIRVAFKMWEALLENNVTLCFRNFGFKRVSVINANRVNAYEW